MEAPEGSSVASLQIAGALRLEILNGTLSPGDRIRQEVIAERFGTSRLPVREALRILEADGLVRTQANKGARVPRLTLGECDELYRAREVLEPILLRDSVPSLSTATISEMRDLQQQLEVDDRDVERYLALDRQFHLTSYSAAKLPFIRSTVEQLLNRTHHYRRAHATLVRSLEVQLTQLHSDHHAILLAVERHDADEASTLMHFHTRRARLELSDHPEIFAVTK